MERIYSGWIITKKEMATDLCIETKPRTKMSPPTPQQNPFSLSKDPEMGPKKTDYF